MRWFVSTSLDERLPRSLSGVEVSDTRSSSEVETNDALKAVNTELVRLYWMVGEYVSRKSEDAVWGEGAMEKLSNYLMSHGPSYKSFTRRNLYRMRQFYEAYRDNAIVSPLGTQLSLKPYQP